MPDYEKPKRKEQVDNEFYEILRHFYWRLFCYLMIPALLLGFIFWLPVVILNNLPDRLNARCSVYDGEIGVRIISETQRTNITTYYWTDNHGDSWHIVHTDERDYQLAQANCDMVDFKANKIVQISTNNQSIYISHDGEISQFQE